MRRTSLLQSVEVFSPLAIFLIASLFLIAVPWPQSEAAVADKGQPKSELFPETASSFFLKDADAQFSFVRDEAGKVVQVNIRRATREFRAKKIK